MLRAAQFFGLLDEKGVSKYIQNTLNTFVMAQEYENIWIYKTFIHYIC